MPARKNNPTKIARQNARIEVREARAAFYALDAEQFDACEGDCKRLTRAQKNAFVIAEARMVEAEARLAARA